MAEILNKEFVSQELRSAIQVIAQSEGGRRIVEVESDVASLLGISQRTLNSWTALSSIPSTIDTRSLLAILWLGVSRGYKDLDWLIRLLRATDIVMVDDPSPKSVHAVLRLAHIEGKSPPDEEIKKVVERLFADQYVDAVQATKPKHKKWKITAPTLAAIFIVIAIIATFLSRQPSRLCTEPIKRTNPTFLPDQGYSLYRAVTDGTGLLINQVRTVRFNEQGLWIGYNPQSEGIDSISYYDRNTELWTHCRGLRLAQNQVVNDIVFANGAIYVSTDGAGVSVLKDNNWRTYTTDHGLPSNKVYGLMVDINGEIWAATLSGVAKLEGEYWKVVYQGNSGELSGNHVLQMFDDKEGNRWFALLDRGISRLTSDHKWEYYYEDDPKLRNVRGIVDDDEKGIWFATNGGGVLRYSNDNWVVFTSANGLPSDNIRDIERDKFGRIWVATTNGVAYTADLGTTWRLHSTQDTMDIEFGCPNCTSFDDIHLVLALTDGGVGHVRIPPRTPTIRIVSVPTPVSLRPNESYIFEVEVEIIGEGFHTGDGDALRSVEPSGVDLHSTHEVIPVLSDMEIGQTYVFSNIDTPISEETPGHYELKWRIWQGRRFVSDVITIAFDVVND